MATVRVGAVTTEGCDLSSEIGAFAISLAQSRDEHYAELRAHGVGLGKELHHVLRRGRGGNVIVSGLAVEKQITNAAADKIGGVALRAQRAGDADGFASFVRSEIYRCRPSGALLLCTLTQALRPGLNNFAPAALG